MMKGCVLIYGIDFTQGDKLFSLFIKVKTFSAQRSTYQMHIRAMQMGFPNASCKDKWAVVIKEAVMTY